MILLRLCGYLSSQGDVTVTSIIFSWPRRFYPMTSKLTLIFYCTSYWHVYDSSRFSHPAVKPSNVVVDAVSLPLLNGSVVDYVTELIGSSFRVMNNPHAKAAGCGCGLSWELKWTGKGNEKRWHIGRCMFKLCFCALDWSTILSPFCPLYTYFNCV